MVILYATIVSAELTAELALTAITILFVILAKDASVQTALDCRIAVHLLQYVIQLLSFAITQ